MDLEILFKLVWTHITQEMVIKMKMKLNVYCSLPWKTVYMYIIWIRNGPLDIFAGMNLTHSLPCTVQSVDNVLKAASIQSKKQGG